MFKRILRFSSDGNFTCLCLLPQFFYGHIILFHFCTVFLSETNLPLTVGQGAACNPEPMCLEWRKKKAKLFVDSLAENGDLLLKLVGEYMYLDDL